MFEGVKQFFESFSMEIMTTAVIAAGAVIINKWRGLKTDKGIVFPEKIIVRKRTSEGSEGLLTIGVLIGNRGKTDLGDVTCRIICGYKKDNGRSCADNEFTDAAAVVENYRRFSYEIRKMPRTFWKHYLNRETGLFDKDFVKVVLTGTAGGEGKKVKKERTYRLNDFIIDLNDPEQYFETKRWDDRSRKEVTEINWNRFTHVEPADMDLQKTITKEIELFVEDRG